MIGPTTRFRTDMPEEALNAANAIGDDSLQRRMQDRVAPDAFTHGTGEQRVRWFRLGFESGDFEQGDTFAADRLCSGATRPGASRSLRRLVG